MAGDRNESKFPPSGCLYCDIAEYQHGRQWTYVPTYEPPKPAQIKARMLARRATKQDGSA